MRFGLTAVSTEGFTEALTVISILRSDPCRDVVTERTVAGPLLFCAAAQDNNSNVIPRYF